MTEKKKAKLIAFVGLPGAGKSVAVEYLSEKGIPKIYFGGIMYGEMTRRGIEITPKSQQEFREKWREEEGKDVIVRKVIEEIHHLIDAGQRTIALDGLYSWTEYKAIKHEFPGELEVIAIVVPRHMRHHRLAVRPERPFTAEEANERDWSEIENLEKGGPIAIADHFIINDGNIEMLRRKVDDILNNDKIFAE